MPKTKLTGVVISRLKPSKDGKRVNHFDTQHKGLCLRVGKRDKTWAYHYRFDGNLRSPALGKFAPTRIDHMDRTAAISAANEIDEQVNQGVDPKFNTKPVKAKPTTKNPNTFQRRVEQFLDYYDRHVKPKTYKHASNLLTSSHVATLKYSDVKKITRVQLVKLLDEMHETPSQGNRLHSYMSVFFNWCWDRGYVDPSPMIGLHKRFKEKPRTRHLDKGELKELWHACKELSYPLGEWCLFTLATGQRPGECRNLKLDDVYDGIWLVDGGDPKNSQRHRIPLPNIALDIIKMSPGLPGPFVFCHTDRIKPFAQGGKPYTSIYKAVGLSNPWHPHDLRRTFETIASEELDVDPHLIGAICNQTSISKPGVANVYNQAIWIKQKRKALKQWNDWLLRVVKDD